VWGVGGLCVFGCFVGVVWGWCAVGGGGGGGGGGVRLCRTDLGLGLPNPSELMKI